MKCFEAGPTTTATWCHRKPLVASTLMFSNNSGACYADGIPQSPYHGIKHYWSAAGKNVFAVFAKTAKTGKKLYQVVRISAIGIRRYVKIKAAANPYMPEDAGYFQRRRKLKGSKLLPAMSAREYRAMASA